MSTHMLTRRAECAHNRPRGHSYACYRHPLPRDMHWRGLIEVATCIGKGCSILSQSIGKLGGGMQRHISPVHSIFDVMLLPFTLHVCQSSLVNNTPLPMFTVTLITHAYKVFNDQSQLLSIKLK